MPSKTQQGLSRTIHYSDAESTLNNSEATARQAQGWPAPVVTAAPRYTELRGYSIALYIPRVPTPWRRGIVAGMCALAVTIVLGQAPRRGLGSQPLLPDPPYGYEDTGLPSHFTATDGPDSVVTTDNTPASNPTTNAGATLGRVLFYDTRLSANDTVSCGSCHLQQHGFSDPRRYSLGFNGRSTRRHAMSLTNARYYARGRFFWDERSASLEAQVLEPIQDPIEMGLSLDAMREKLARVPFYRPLFESAFGTSAVTVDRVARALAQFVRALVSAGAPYDQARAAGRPGSPEFTARLSAPVRLGHRLFVTAPNSGTRGAGCSRCHVGDAQISLSPRNIGLDPDGIGDPGANDGRFKAPSLRNVAARAPYMHDGRFGSLREVIEHYDRRVEPSRFLDMTLLDRRLVVTGGPIRPVRLQLTNREIDGLVAFLRTLTDDAFLSDPRFSNPFLSR